MSDFERFFSKVQFDDCWTWTAARYPSGYGCFRIGSRTNGTRRLIGAHRWAYEQLIGLIPDGLQLDHLCRNRACVNPDHLEPVTNRENVLRGVSPFAAKAKQPSCLNGHPFDVANTILKGTARECRECGRAAAARWRLRQGIPTWGERPAHVRDAATGRFERLVR